MSGQEFEQSHQGHLGKQDIRRGDGQKLSLGPARRRVDGLGSGKGQALGGLGPADIGIHFQKTGDGCGFPSKGQDMAKRRFTAPIDHQQFQIVKTSKAGCIAGHVVQACRYAVSKVAEVIVVSSRHHDGQERLTSHFPPIGAATDCCANADGRVAWPVPRVPRLSLASGVFQRTTGVGMRGCGMPATGSYNR